jgi:hypothetical protein
VTPLANKDKREYGHGSDQNMTATTSAESGVSTSSWFVIAATRAATGRAKYEVEGVIVYLNPSSEAAYMAANDPERLLAVLGPGRGARTPLIYLLMAVSARRLSTARVGEVNVQWRSVAKWT